MKTKPTGQFRYWGNLAPTKNKTEFFDVITTPGSGGDSTVATIRMYGPVDSWGGWWGISAADVSEVLDALPDTVDQIVLRINSPGGEVWEGMSILNMLRAHKAHVVAVVDGIAASAASFIAAGCDETVMSPGTQMMIHSPISWDYGNADDLRKTAEILDSIEESIITIYRDKAGESTWGQLMADETWYTAQQAVDAGLADKVAVVKDAGETLTPGGDEPDDGEALTGGIEDRYAAAQQRLMRSQAPNAALAAQERPSSTEPGTAKQKEKFAMTNALKNGLLNRLGVTDAEISDEALLAAVDEALAEQADTTTTELPEGVTVIDSAILADLQAQAAQGVEALAAQDRTRRERIVNDALESGRIAPASQELWLNLLEENEGPTAALLASMPTGSVPLEEIGHADAEATAEDALYATVFGQTQKEA